MTRTLSARFALGLLFALGIAATAGAQTPDSRWNDWVGCWTLVPVSDSPARNRLATARA